MRCRRSWTTDDPDELTRKAAGDQKEDPAQIAKEWLTSVGLA